MIKFNSIKMVCISVFLIVSNPNIFSQENYLNNNWLYVGARFGMNMTSYNNNKSDNLTNNNVEINNPNMDFIGAIQLFVPIINNFGIQTEINFISGYVTESNSITVNGFPGKLETVVSVNSFLIPILVRYNYTYNIFSFSGLTGVYFTLPLQTLQYNAIYWGENSDSLRMGEVFIFRSTFGLMLGVNLGINIGAGRLFLDVRYAFDTNNFDYRYEYLTFLNINNLYRNIVPITIGYEIGTIKKN